MCRRDFLDALRLLARNYACTTGVPLVIAAPLLFVLRTLSRLLSSRSHTCFRLQEFLFGVLLLSHGCSEARL
jgi:hypothetical protein